MLTLDHGPAVQIDMPTLEELVAANLADPEFLRQEIKRMGFQSVESFTAAMPAPYPAAVVNPLGPPSVATTTFTVDLALANPTRVITPMVLDLTRQRFFADRAFTSAGGVTGGAVVYDPAVYPDLYADRDIQRVEPGTEFPIIAFSRRAPQVATVEKWGGKFYFTDEARDRNDTSQFSRAMRQMGNTIVRKINQRSVQQLDAAITANARSVIGNDWTAVNTLTGAGGSNYTAYPARDFAKADLIAEREEMGINYNLAIMNPDQMFLLEGIYGDKLSALLGSIGMNFFVTNRVAQGVMYVMAAGQLGEMRIEKPLSTETWRDPNGKEQTWVQSSVRPLFFVDNPFAVLKFTGLGVVT